MGTATHEEVEQRSQQMLLQMKPDNFRGLLLPSLPEVSRRRAFCLTLLARLGKNSSVQKGVMAILHTL